MFANRNLMLVTLAGLLLGVAPVSNRWGVAHAQTPLGTAFTYQGRLTDAGSPASGPHQMTFTLWERPLGGSQVGPTLTFDGGSGNPPPVDVVDGLFTVELDFGAKAFTGDARWLEITVNRVPLSPRQPLTAAPYAQFALSGSGRVETLEVTGGAPLNQPLAGWGRNDFGQTNVPAGTFIAVAAGGWHSLAIRSDGTLAGWGRNFEGQTNVPAGTFTAVAAGGAHSLAIRSDGTLAGWGLINVPAGTFTAVAAGLEHSLAIHSDGTLVGWGSNDDGQTNVPAGTFTAVAAGGSHSLAIRSDGTLAGWGLSTSGQINVPAGTFIAVAAGSEHSLAIRSDGTLAGWGANFEGQANVPAGTFTAVAAGLEHSLAIGADPDPAPALLLHNDAAFKPGSPTWTIWSDRRLKDQIRPLSGAIDRLLALRGVTFEWRDTAHGGGRTGPQIGLVADEVQRVLPAWVGRDPEGYQTLTVSGFEALSVEALRDLRAEKDAQLAQRDARIASLEQEIWELKDMVRRISVEKGE